MTTAELSALSVEDAATLSPLVHALWKDAHNDWEGAHEVAQATGGVHGAWLHAYLHRKEGETFNAAYWYRKAGKPVCAGTLAEEWHSLAAAFLAS